MGEVGKRSERFTIRNEQGDLIGYLETGSQFGDVIVLDANGHEFAAVGSLARGKEVLINEDNISRYCRARRAEISGRPRHV
ncbi:MAG: hypothetical protein K2Y05_12215 [Hyphomicrobiaceae bacterium]|nr:hypothetical protein [Hyphomicrobiaceae bacterium]